MSKQVKCVYVLHPSWLDDEDIGPMCRRMVEHGDAVLSSPLTEAALEGLAKAEGRQADAKLEERAGREE